MNRIDPMETIVTEDDYRRAHRRFWLLIAGAVALSVVVLVVLNYAGGERRAGESQRAAVSGRPDWMTDADIARIEQDCKQHTVYELAPGLAKIVCEE